MLIQADKRREESREIIFTHGGGRFANQLMNFGHLIGLAEEYPGLRITDYAFWPYADLCNGTEHNPQCAYPPRVGPGLWVRPAAAVRGLVWKRRQIAAHRVMGMALHKIMPWRSLDASSIAPDGAEVKIGSPEFLARLRPESKTLLAGWPLRDWELFDKHQEAIRRFLMPSSRFCRVADEFIRRLRNQFDVLVGLLIRQTDYRLWADGRYFFDASVYRTFIAALCERFGPRATIVVATDEEQPPGVFEGLPVTWCTGEKAGSGDYMESFAELSQCDVVASVPSTFSAWAAFFGKKPILPISAVGEDLTQVPLLDRHLLDARLHRAFREAVN